jgi:hypothetical protein
MEALPSNFLAMCAWPTLISDIEMIIFGELSTITAAITRVIAIPKILPSSALKGAIVSQKVG